jgi:hypothetical protein
MSTNNEEAIAILLNVLNYLHVDNKKKAFDEVIKALVKLREDNGTDTNAAPSIDTSAASSIDTNDVPIVDTNIDTSAVPSGAPIVDTNIDTSAVPSWAPIVNTNIDTSAVPSGAPIVDTNIDTSAVPSGAPIVDTNIDTSAVPSGAPIVDTNIDTSAVPIVDTSAVSSGTPIVDTNIDTSAVHSSSVDMCADNIFKTSFDISVFTSTSKSIVTSTSKSVITSNGKSVVASSGKSVVTSGGKTVRRRWSDYEDDDDDDDDDDDNNKKTTFLYSEVVTSKIPTTITTRENSKIVQVKPTKPVKKLPMRFTTIRYYDIRNYINMSNNKSRDVNTILENMFALNMTNSEIISVKEYSEGVKIIFTIPDSEFKKALFKDCHSGIKYKLGNIIFSDHEPYHVPSQYK